jgi:hypothetical protein
VATIADTIPAILENLAVIEQEIQTLDRERDSKRVTSWSVQLEPVIQRLLVREICI